jgi:CubicO group peptidase (beta-lactamase class C family)
MIDERIERALERALELGEVGVQVAAYLGGDLIIDACIGVSGEDGRPVENDTLMSIFSASKGMLATLVHLYAERGWLGLDNAVATYWPEFSAEGKRNITIRHVMTHQAGVPLMPADLTFEELGDWASIVGRVAQLAPLSSPGKANHYHGVSIYYILGEVLRRVDPLERLFDEILRSEVCEPLGIDDLWFRLPEEHDRRRATLVAVDELPALPEAYKAMVPRSHELNVERYNSPETHRVLTGNILTTARSGARFWALLANLGRFDGVRLLSEERVRSMLAPRPNNDEPDGITGATFGWSVGGFHLGGPSMPMGPVVGDSSTIVGHSGGGGGSIGWADVATGLSVMITHNRFLGGPMPFVDLGAAIRAVAAEHLT